MNTIIKLLDVSLSYRISHGMFKSERLEVLKDISFDIMKGEMVSIIGFNGSGKTTTLSVIADILKPDKGTVSVLGRVVPFLGLGIGFNPELSGKENVYLYGTIMGLRRKEINKMYNSIVEFSELERYMDLKIKEFSSGMYVRLGFSVAIHTKPDILIIDEVLAVGDYAFQKKCLDKINEMKCNGVTILFVSHNLGLVTRFSDKVILLHDGRIAGSGEPETMVKEFMKIKTIMPSVSINRRGSSEVVYTDYRIMDDRTEFSDNEIVLKLFYENKAGLDYAIPGIALYSAEGVLISGPNMKDSTGELLALKDNGEITVSIDSGLLNPGKYFITLGMYDKTNRFPFDHIDYAMSFEKRGEIRDYTGSVKIPVNWKNK